MSEKPKFAPVDLTEMRDAGVLFTANEQFFWPLGLALTWDVPTVPVNPYIWCENERTHDAHDWDAPLGHLNRCEGTKSSGTATNLHIREWQFSDGHHERIEDSSDDLARARKSAFFEWQAARQPLT